MSDHVGFTDVEWAKHGNSYRFPMMFQGPMEEMIMSRTDRKKLLSPYFALKQRLAVKKASIAKKEGQRSIGDYLSKMK